MIGEGLVEEFMRIGSTEDWLMICAGSGVNNELFRRRIG